MNAQSRVTASHRTRRRWRGLALAGALLAGVAVSAPANAQSSYPSRPIQLLVPYGAGGIADVGMRILSEKLSARLKQQVVVENRPGAGGIIAAKAGATATPDGYTVLMTAAINAADNSCFASTASLWEIAIKSRLGKIDPGLPLAELDEYLMNAGLTFIPIGRDQVLAEFATKPKTRDPFDRLLLATCQVEGLRLVTLDRALSSHALAWK